MGFYQFKNITIKGVATCVPEKTEKISDIFSPNESDNFTKNTGIVQRHIADSSICASDLCLKAASDIITKLHWNKDEIDVLIFVSQTPDYILPATSNILQEKLRLSKNCFCLDISLGCSGYIYGMSLLSSLLQNIAFRKGLLLVGDTITKFTSVHDKSIYPLFGDAGTATALEYDDAINTNMSFVTGSDGKGEDAIKISHGGARNLFDENCLTYENYGSNNTNKRKKIDLSLNGIEIFNFAIKTVPETINTLLQKINLTIDEVDFFILHQANFFMNETIKKKLKINPEKFIYSIKDFGNTNGASIPLTFCYNYHNKSMKDNFVMCGFGVGLSWGALHYKNENKDEIICSFSYL
ncbi:MAG: ketoacyl-ACP synthase III [Chitinophagaceae bacterium]|nr:ketoacyl-ACP synthase III [Chitinophagaceae bacterium]